MRFAQVTSGVVVNVLEADEAFAADRGLIASETAQIGWLYDGETFTAPPPEPEPVPASVSMRQARLALSRAGLLTNAESTIAAMAGPEGDEARIEWEYATELRRGHPLITGLGQSLGLNDAAIDDLFKQAAAII